jgi:ribosomal protein S18 acetylase RimI-like enzyme
MHWRHAGPADLGLLAELNRDLIVDEGHHNPMGVPELKERMRRWLEGEYSALLFLRDGAVVAYALLRTDECSRAHLRQFFVVRAARRQGIGREALRLLRREAVPPGTPVVLEVLTNNAAARAFYAACGFREYAVTLLAEAEPSG